MSTSLTNLNRVSPIELFHMHDTGANKPSVPPRLTWWIRQIHWIIVNITIEVEQILITDRVGLHKANKIGVIDASRVVIEFQHWDQDLPGIAVPPQIIAARLAELNVMAR